MMNFSGSQDHRLESLEGRSLLSALPLPAAAGPAAVVVVADASFLNASSDPSPTTGQESANDADQYDFGGAWGTQAAGIQVHANLVDLDNGAVDQSPGGPDPRLTPADLSSVVPQTYIRAAAYKGDVPVITDNMDPVIDDAPATPEADPAPVMQAPIVTAPAPTAQPQAAQAMSISAPSGDAGFSWIEVGGAKKKADGLVTVDQQVVIANTFIAG